MSQMKVDDVVENRFRVIKKIGEGLGEVYLVRDTQDGTDWALKCCIEPDDNSMRRLRRELQAMLQLTHPNVMRIHHDGTGHTPPYYVMPLATHSIADEIAALKDDHVRAVDVFSQVALGVAAIHASGVVHRDIKPSNMLRMSDDRVVVSDLGVARIQNLKSTTITSKFDMLGTGIYMAPEQFPGSGLGQPDARTDVFQLGKCLYELLSGISPELIELARIPDEFRHVVRLATRPNPDDRYQSVSKMIDGLNEATKVLGGQTQIQIFDHVLNVIALDEAFGECKTEDFAKLLAAHSALNDLDDSHVVDLFDRIPDSTLRLATRSCVDAIQASVIKYSNSLLRMVKDKPWSYADRVANRMAIVFDASSDVITKTAALRTCLAAAVTLNRFHAMDEFIRLLKSIKDTDTALAVAAMLKERRSDYDIVVDQVQPRELHLAIQNVNPDSNGGS